MRTAPAVSVNSRIPAWAHVGVVACCVAAMLVSLAWAAQSGGGWRYTSVLVGLGVALSWLAEVRKRVAWCLSWDGATWRLAPAPHGHDGVEGDARLVVDLGDRLLVRFRPTGRRRADWLPLQRNMTAGDWHALRCALHARGMSPPVTAVSGATGA